MSWLDILAPLGGFTPAIKSLRGLNNCVARGQAAIDGEKILKRAGIPCAFDVDFDGQGCSLSVKKEDVARAMRALK